VTATAEDAFAEFVTDCGPEAHAMPATCQTYLEQYMANFPEERDLLLAGLQVGVPRHILKHDGGVGYDDYLSTIADKFVGAAGISADEAKWTVGAWAYAVGRPVGTEIVKDSDLGRMYSEAPKHDYVASYIITAIVVAGGFFGGFIPGCFYAGFFSGGNPAAFGLILLGTCLWTSAAAYGGWWFGRGNEYPWGGFAVAFGAALSTGLILAFVLHPFIKPFVLFSAVFGAVYKTANRAGKW
jgi:hypothetical protein